MSAKIKATAGEQIELFRPMPDRPIWSNLPEATKQEVRRLLAHMLTAGARQRGESAIGKERHDDSKD